MKIGILGGTGFVGQNMAETMTNAGHHVEVVSRRTMPSVFADDYNDVAAWILARKFDAVVNLAAECGGIGRNKQHPAELWVASTRISCGVLDGVLQAKMSSDGEVNPKLIMVGTVCSYAADCPVPFKEEYLMNYGEPEPTNRAYGVAKLNALYGARTYQEQHGLKICNLIPVNMYGKYDNFNLEYSHVIPAMIRKFIDARDDGMQSVTLWGDGSPTREFLHVTDFSLACLLAIDNCESSEFINIGTGVETSMFDLANMIAEIVEYRGEIAWDVSRPNGQQRRCLDISKAKKILNYEPSISLQDGLLDTVRWYEHERATAN